jgi:hypothetical protein
MDMATIIATASSLIPCKVDSDCPSFQCLDLSNGMCFFPPCGTCVQEEVLNDDGGLITMNDVDMNMSSKPSQDFIIASMPTVGGSDVDKFLKPEGELIMLDSILDDETLPTEVAGGGGGFSMEYDVVFDAPVGDEQDMMMLSMPTTAMNDDGMSDFIPVNPAEDIFSTWPSGTQLMDYTACDFECCTNDDCQSVGGCCMEGMCEAKGREEEVCRDVIGPPADVLCGFDAWTSYKHDGFCGRGVASSLDKETTTTNIISGTTTQQIVVALKCNANADCAEMGGCCLSDGFCYPKTEAMPICWELLPSP